MSRPYDSYPDSWGAQRASVIPHAGPSSYTQVSVGTPPTPATGGDATLTAVEAGLKYIDYAVAGITDSGNYRVDVIPTVASGTGPNGAAQTTVRLKWTALRTASIGGQSQTINTEAASATDLSAEVVRVLVIGPK